MTTKLMRLIASFTFALGIAGLLLWLLNQSSSQPIAHAAGPRFVATSGADSGDCANSASPCATIQYAVDVANDGDEIRVASGVYTDVHVRPRNDVTITGVVTQMVYISKTVTIQGGYTTTNWMTANPITNPTTLDAQRRGRVMYITGNISPTVTGLRLAQGHARGLGGTSFTDCGSGIYIITATAVLSGNNVSGNGSYTIENNNYPSGDGGGVCLASSAATLQNNIISGNTGANFIGGNGYANGGGVYLHLSPATLTGNTITNNLADGQGFFGFAFGGGIYLDQSAATLIGNNISDNVAFSNSANPRAFGEGGDGGGVALYQSAATLIGNRVINNRAIFGGGLYMSKSPATLSSNVIISNTGGGIQLTASDATLFNDVIADNRVTFGGAVWVDSSTPRFFHTTIARNSGGDGSGVSVFTGMATFTNTILISHTVGISVTTGSTATLNGVLWYNNGTNTGRAGLITVTNAYTGSPAFLADGYHLSAVSAAIDRGVPVSVTTDIDGDARPFGAAPDLGADEYVGPPPTKTYFPLVAR